jgi:hypothetical protein
MIDSKFAPSTNSITKYKCPLPVFPNSCTPVMCGWLSRAIARASRTNRWAGVKGDVERDALRRLSRFN